MNLRRSSLLVLVVAVAFLLTGCFGGNPQVTWSGPAIANSELFVGTSDGRIVSLNAQNQQLRWRFPADDQTLISVYATPTLADDVVYVAGWNGTAYALDRQTGTPRSQFQTAGSIVAPVIPAGDLVLVASGDRFVYALDRQDLTRQRWQYETNNKIWAAPAVDGDTVYVASMDGTLTALDLATGAERWKFQAEGALLSSPLVHQGVVYVGGAASTLYAVDAATGALLWPFTAGNWIWTQPLVVDDTLFVGSLDQNLYALGLDGQKRWQVAVEGWIRTNPVSANGLIVAAWGNHYGQGGVFAVDPVAKQIKWNRPVAAQVEGPVTVQNDLVYVNTVNSTVYALNLGDGSIVWTYPENR